MTTLTRGTRVMRHGFKEKPTGPWVVLQDITDQRGTYVLGHEQHGPTPAWVTVQAYPSQLEVLEGPNVWIWQDGKPILTARPDCPTCGSTATYRDADRDVHRIHYPHCNREA